MENKQKINKNNLEEDLIENKQKINKNNLENDLENDSQSDSQYNVKRPKIELKSKNKEIEKQFDNFEWKFEETIMILNYKTPSSSSKIASFDLDHTLVKPKSGGIFPKDSFDWEILYNVIYQKLQLFYSKGFKIVIFTNQSEIRRKGTFEMVKNRIEHFASTLNHPIQVFVSLEKDKFRKPSIKMWNYLENEENEEIRIDLKKSFFVGDAAGRKKDFSNSDLKFAENIGIEFYTPEQFFLDEPKPKPKIIQTDIRDFFIPKKTNSKKK
ncbi:bifunctional polynucleotide phosphatase/kinase [Anaeramoeba ignava]|uniref:Bifunctional polynucleotide phosphatase/kinase n=1 Tax=Anaeramoeba ignava TaxID=1746090 RepID=A0A9Q0R9Z0_ANAIG|nr:bifunctional polynucleotide phosphatase/kinase [Anaeramoeba ignava]